MRVAYKLFVFRCIPKQKQTDLLKEVLTDFYTSTHYKTAIERSV